MSKQKRNIIAVILCIITLAIAIGIFLITNKASPQKDNESDFVSSNESSIVNVEDIESEKQNSENETNTTQSNIVVVEPDETQADKILEEKKKEKTSNVSSSPSNNSSNNTQSKTKPTESSSSQSYEDEKKELENTAKKYLREHNIDPKTAGETGELCPHCSKKIWNPDKYGFFIPGMPENYETSGYCLGTCGITFE